MSIQQQQHPESRRAILYLCYEAVRAAALKRNFFDPHAMSQMAESLANKVGEFLIQPQRSIVEFTPVDVQTYEYLCDILDNLQQTLPIMNHFNVKLTVERFDYLEDHATAITHSHQGGKT